MSAAPRYGFLSEFLVFVISTDSSYRTVPLLNSTSPLVTLLLSPPTPTRLAASRSSLKSAAPVETPTAATASLPVVAVVLAVAVVTVPVARAAVVSSVMAVVDSLPVAAVTLRPRAAAPRPRPLKFHDL